jgi:hypothetical protein
MHRNLRFVFFGKRRVFAFYMWFGSFRRRVVRAFSVSGLYHRLFLVRLCSRIRLRFRFFLGGLGHDEAPI